MSKFSLLPQNDLFLGMHVLPTWLCTLNSHSCFMWTLRSPSKCSPCLSWGPKWIHFPWSSWNNIQNTYINQIIWLSCSKLSMASLNLLGYVVNSLRWPHRLSWFLPICPDSSHNLFFLLLGHQVYHLGSFSSGNKSSSFPRQGLCTHHPPHSRVFTELCPYCRIGLSMDVTRSEKFSLKPSLK